MMHIGQLIRDELIRQQRTPTWLAQNIYCSRQHIYTIFKKDNIDTELLYRISIVLRHNFFADIAEYVSKKMTQSSSI
ncbi:MAG: XRE family transcriptional regulator [Muribaculaceae bacterium]